MNIHIEGTSVHLQGDLTLSGMTPNEIKSFAYSLQQIELWDGMDVRIDCRRIRTIDINGLKLIDVWMQCARFMGVKLKLVNLSDSMQNEIQKIYSMN
jgi:ABC-type transporter Mla MlaB component